MKKKALSLIVAIVMVLTMLPVMGLTANWTTNAPTVTFSVSDPDADNVIAATVKVSASDMICSYTLTVEYDSDVVDVAADKGTFVYDETESTIGLTLEGNKISDIFVYRHNFAGASSGKKLFYIGDARAAGISKNGFTATMYFKVKDSVIASGDEVTAAFRLVNDIVGSRKTFEVANANYDLAAFPSSGTTVNKIINAKPTVQPEPVTITSISSTDGAVSLAWQGQDGVDGYRVYRKTGTGKWTSILSSTTATSYTDTTVTEGTTYSYTVRSYIGSTYSAGYADTAKSIKVTAAAVEPLPVTITSIACANGAVSLAWQGQNGVDGYRVYRKTGTGKWETVLSSTTATSYKDTTVTEGKTYSYTVRSNVGSTWSTGYADTAKTIKVTAAAVEPAPVTITSISYANGAVSLAWQGQDGVDGYRVYRKTGTGKWETVLSSTTATSYKDATVTEGKTYSYTVRSNVGSTWSTGYADTAKTIKVTAAAVEPAPVTITSISYANGAVSLAWQGQDGVDGYRVYRKTGTGKWETVLSSTTATSYKDTTVTEGKTYSYTIRSNVGSTWSTGYADTAKTITTKAAVEPAPVTITSISYANGAVSLAWQGQDGVDGYRVYRKTGTGKWETVLSSTTATSYKDATVTEGKTYSYTIRSKVGSTWSTGYADTAKTITTKAAAEPAPVTITSIAYANGAVSLAWQGQDGVDGYRVYRKTGTGKWTTVLSSTTATSYTDTTVTEGTTYSYTVRSNVGSTWSTGYDATAKTIKVAPAVPADVNINMITQSSTGGIKIAWDAADNVDGYRVYKKSGSGSWKTALSNTTDTTFTDTDVTPGVMYYYTIRSVKGGVWSTGYNDTAKSFRAGTPKLTFNNGEVTGISNKSITTLVIPQSIDGIAVTSIAKNAFSYCSSLTSVTIPSGVTSIGSGAFNNCKALTSVNISDVGAWCGIDFGGYNANPLYYANHLYLNGKEMTKLVIPEGVTSIGRCAFYSCTGLTSVTIPSSVTSIGYYAFYGCSGLTSVTIPSSVTSIDYGAFEHCTGLTSIKVDADNTAYTSVNGVLFTKDKKTLVTYPAGKSGAYTIPSSVTSIGDNAFEYCSGLTSVKIPSSVTSIGGSAFWGCDGLTSVTIPSSVTSIGGSAFGNCDGLTTVKIPEGVTSIGWFAFQDCDGLTSVTIPSSVTSIDSSPFLNCDGITSINVASGNTAYTSVNGVLFTKDMKTLVEYPCGKEGTSYDIPSGVTSIGSSSFEGCKGLTSVTIPEGVTKISGYAFEYCSGLTSVTIPVSVTYISWEAFAGCENLKDVYYTGNDKQWRSINIEEDNYELSWATLHCSGPYDPGFIFEDGTILGVEDIDITSLIIPGSINGEKVTAIGREAFAACYNLTSVTIQPGVEEIGYGAFDGCFYLSSVTIPSSVKIIGDEAFSGCSLTSINIPSGVTSIGHDAFPRYCLTSINVDAGNTEYASADGVLFTKDKKVLLMYPCGKEGTSYDIPSGVTAIGENAFNNCQSLTSVTIPSTVMCISTGAFEGCGVTSLTIPYSVMCISDNAFGERYYATSITDIYYSGSEERWNSIYHGQPWNMPFTLHCTGTGDPVEENYFDFEASTGTILEFCDPDAESAVIPETLYGIKIKTIGSYAFYDCSELKSITIPPSIKYIEQGAFSGCNLQSVYISDLEAWLKIDAPGDPLSTFMYGAGKPAADLYVNGTLLTDLVIPSSFTSINNFAMAGCRSLKSVSIPSSVTSIGDAAFWGCSNLTSITIPSSVKRIGAGAFGGCGFTSVAIPSGVTSIESYTFLACQNLTSVTIPASVTIICPGAFVGNDSLTDVYYAGTQAQWESITKESNSSLDSAAIHYNSAN